METFYKIFPIGRVRKKDDSVSIEIYDTFKDAMLGLEQFSHIQVLYWFHENDTPQQRAVLQVHPRNNPQNPLTGVFATHSPIRPNLIALTVCRIVSIDKTVITIDTIDARDGSPVIDIKSYNAKVEAKPPFRIPKWAQVAAKTD